MQFWNIYRMTVSYINFVLGQNVLVIVAQMATTIAQLEFFGEGGRPPHPPSVLTFIESMLCVLLWRAKARHNMSKHVQAC